MLDRRTTRYRSTCLSNALRPFFPSVNVNNFPYSPTSEVQFFSGVPWWAKSRAKAITLGVDVHYDPNEVKFNGGVGEYLSVIIEEVAHVEQFLKVWSNMDKNVNYRIVNKGGRFGWRVTRVYDPPSYNQARTRWKDLYVDLVVMAVRSGHADYDNLIEWSAKNKRDTVFEKLIDQARKEGRDNICGFGFDFNREYRQKY